MNKLAQAASIETAHLDVKPFSGEYDTFLAKRFD